MVLTPIILNGYIYIPVGPANNDGTGTGQPSTGSGGNSPDGNSGFYNPYSGANQPAIGTGAPLTDGGSNQPPINVGGNIIPTDAK